MSKFKIFIATMALISTIFAGGICYAQSISVGDLIKKIPALKQGVAWSVLDSKVNYLTTMDIVTWKGFALEAGYAADAENTGSKLVAVISYDVINLKERGVTVPILDLIDLRLGMYAGVGDINLGDGPAMRGNNEFDWGISATAVSVKF